jgi:hypothetical protein
MGLQLFDALFYLFVALIHWEYLMKLMLVLAKDAIRTKQLVLSLAKNGDYTIMLKAPDRII